MAPPIVDRMSAELRTTIFYISFFMGGGAAVTFLPIWLTEKGITPDQIGIINALPIFLILASNLLVGRVADRASDWRQVIVIGVWLAAVIAFGLLFVNEFWGIMLVWALCALPAGAVGPVIDAATMRMTRRNGTDFGAIRAWGTVGYLVFNAVTGFLVIWFGSDFFVPLFIGLCVIRAAAALILPRFRAPPTELTLTAVQPSPARLSEVFKPWFLLPLIGFSMVFATHYLLNAFTALVWKEQGISADIIGPLIALAGFSEALMMFAFRRFSHRFSARNMILVSAICSALRWIAMGFSPTVPVLIFLQLTHSVTYALGFLGCIHFITNWTHENVAAEAQSLFTMVQQGMAVVALIVFGWLFTFMGAHTFFVAAGFAALGAFCIWLSLQLQQPKAVAME
ncbi:MFS transporter [Devosia sp.]|uniref:MFS transporter n=1 Tax=Devosia sp. TaxID=1871048 RepID=UPI0032639269